MSGPRAGALYTPEILALAAGLADYPYDPAAPLQGEARSRTCGSTLAFSAAIDSAGALSSPGARVKACAIGQAAAAVMLAAASGLTRADIASADSAIAAWLRGEGNAPSWPGFAVLHPACAFPARHEALRLPWKAALAALSNPPAPG